MTPENKKIFAFTLMEVLVTMGVLVIILTMSAISYKAANSRTTIIMAAYQVAGDVRLAQSYAASARQISTNPNPEEEKYNVWGVYFDKNNPGQYEIFVDKNFNGYYGGANESWRTVKLPKGITVSAISVNKGGTIKPSEALSAVYFPPSPTTSIAILEAGNPVQEDSAVITIQDDVNLSKKDITLNFFGLIDVTK